MQRLPDTLGERDKNKIMWEKWLLPETMNHWFYLNHKNSYWSIISLIYSTKYIDYGGYRDEEDIVLTPSSSGDTETWGKMAI